MENAALDLLDVLVQAQYRRDKMEALGRANAILTKLRYLLRLSGDLHLLGARRNEYAAERLDEIGKMVGGWRRQQQSRASGCGMAGTDEDIPKPL